MFQFQEDMVVSFEYLGPKIKNYVDFNWKIVGLFDLTICRKRKISE